MSELHFFTDSKEAELLSKTVKDGQVSLHVLTTIRQLQLHLFACSDTPTRIAYLLTESFHSHYRFIKSQTNSRLNTVLGQLSFWLSMPGNELKQQTTPSDGPTNQSTNQIVRYCYKMDCKIFLQH